MVAIYHLIALLACVSAAKGLCVSTLSSSLATLAKKLALYDVTEDTELLVSKLVANWSSVLKFPNLLAGLDNVTEAVLEREYSLGLPNGDEDLEIEELSLKYGYPLKNYTVITEDGYKLKIYRIQRNGPPVFIMHGLLSSSDDFMTAGPESALAYLLADLGYDVWLGNARGNKHSRQNVRLSPSNSKFWDFSWHEIGIYDLPVMIDFVLKETAQTKLRYIGHSQGTTSFYVMASERPEYNKKISIMISLAPVGYTANAFSPVIRLLAGPEVVYYPLIKLVGLNELLADDAVTKALKALLCGNGVTATIFCSNLLFLIHGFNYAQLNVTNLPVIYRYIPAGAATKQLIHYSQGIVCRDFRQFDYGLLENIERYGSLEPPKYKLQNIVAPVALIYSGNDWLSSITDVERLSRELGNVIDYTKVPFSAWNHLDYLWAKDLKTILFGHIQYLLNLV